jgi:predicted nucleic acid-binding protein
MRGKVFLDTNVFVYTQSKGEQDKRDIALNAIEKYDCYTSTQVFNEISLLKNLISSGFHHNRRHKRQIHILNNDQYVND